MPKARVDRPRYLKSERNRDGTLRWYWRPKDRPGVSLGNDAAAAIVRATELNRQRDAERAGMEGPVAPAKDSVRALADAYKTGPEFTRLAAKTRHEYDRHLSWLVGMAGDLSAGSLTARAVQELKRAGASTPWETNARLRTIRLLWSWGRRQGLVAGENPAADFRQLATAPRDVVWTSQEISALLQHGVRPLRLAIALGLYSLQREGDVLVMPWTAYDGLRLELRQRKTGKLVGFQVHPVLKAALDATRRQAITILVDDHGRPFKPDAFRHLFALERYRLGLRPELQFRDLRRTGAVTLGRMGVTTPRIAALGGWEISRVQSILETYIPLDEEMASAAVQAWASSQ